jgi:hypothetical protein
MQPQAIFSQYHNQKLHLHLRASVEREREHPRALRDRTSLISRILALAHLCMKKKNVMTLSNDF